MTSPKTPLLPEAPDDTVENLIEEKSADGESTHKLLPGERADPFAAGLAVSGDSR